MNSKNGKHSKSGQKNTNKLLAQYVPIQKIAIEFHRTTPRASQNVARSIRNCLPDVFGLANQEVIIELVDEEPTEEMRSALKSFWERVFAELLPPEKESSVKAKRKK